MKRLILSFLLLLPYILAAQINTDKVMLMGRNALYYDDYVLSIQYFNEVINAKPFLYDSYYFRAIAKFYLEDYRGAEDDCSKAISLNPFIEDSYQLRGLCRIKQDKFEEAVNDYTKVIEYKPLDQVSWYNRVLCRIHLKQYDNAMQELQEMLVKWPSYTKCYEIEAQILLQSKDTVKADSVLKIVLEKNSTNGDAWGVRGMIAYNKGNIDYADTLLTNAIKFSSNNADYYINRALVRYYQKRLREAMDDYDSAINIDAENFLAHYNRGLLRAQVGENNKAIEDFNFVLDKEPDNLLALFNRAVLLEKTGGYRQAIKDVSKVISEFPHFWTGYELRARCRSKIGDKKGAASDERKLFVAQLDRTFNHKKYKNKSTRKRREINIEDYQKIVVDDDTDKIEKYASEYRGKIQNNKVEARLVPVFAFSTSSGQKYNINTTTAYWQGLDQWNNKKLTALPVKLTCATTSSNKAYVDGLFSDIKRINGILLKDSDNAALNLACAILYRDAKDYNNALVHINKSIEKNPRDAMALIERAAIKLNMSEMRGKEQEQDIDKSNTLHVEAQSILNDLNNAAKLMPNNEYVIYNCGCVCYVAKDYSEAEKYFSEAIGINPKFAEAYYNRALTRLAISKKSEALSDLSKAGELGLYESYSVIKQNSK